MGSFKNKVLSLRNMGREKRMVFLMSVVALIIAMSPLFTKDCLNGHDIEYHLLRIESLKEGILMGKPFLKVNVLFFGGAGYASSMFYPDLLLYIPAILRVLGVSINLSYHIFVGLCVLLCFLSSFYCLEKITGSLYPGLCFAILISLCNYHLEDVYVRAAVGEYTAFIFVPFVIYGIYNVIYEGMDRPFILGLGYGGLLLCHTGSFVICIFFGAVLFLIHIKSILKTPGVIWRFIITVILTAAITCFYWLPLLEQLLSAKFYVSVPWMNPADDARLFVQLFYSEFPSIGAALFILYIPRLLLRKGDIKGDSALSRDGGLEDGAAEIGEGDSGVGAADRMNAADIGKGAAGAVTSLRLLGFADTLFIAGFIMSLFSTKLFPWDRFGKYMSFIQFPWRFFLIASVCLAAADSIILFLLCRHVFTGRKEGAISGGILTKDLYVQGSQYQRKEGAVSGGIFTCLGLLMVMSFFAFPHLEENAQGYFDYSNDYYSYEPFTANVIAGEWLPVTVTDRDSIIEDSKVSYAGDDRLDIERVKNELFIEVDKEYDFIDAPFIYYKGYRAELKGEDGTTLRLAADGEGKNGFVRVYTEGRKGRLRVYYGGTFLQKLSFVISLLTFVICLVIIFSRSPYVGRKKDKQES